VLRLSFVESTNVGPEVTLGAGGGAANANARRLPWLRTAVG
jgi:hypothetical protein